MPDLHHVWGQDLNLGSNGDLLLVDSSEMGRQRTLRRLLSNQGDLVFHVDYGAGLPRRVGATTDAGMIEAAVRRQMNREAAVSQDPPPVVKVTPFFGGVNVRVTYRDAATGRAVVVGFSVEG